RLHNGRMTYTYGAALDSVGVIQLHDGFGGPLAYDARDADLFHEMYAYETISGDVRFKHNEFWDVTLAGAATTESDPSAFGNRVAFERSSYNGDIILTTASEPLVDRSSGTTRYETAVAASKGYFRSGADIVVLCTGENFPDALSAAPWARFLKAPVLLARRTSVPESVMDEIERLGATDIWIVGGESAVSSAVKTQLEAAGLNVDRQLQGADRYATSAKIANFLYDAVVGDGRPFSGQAFVARGDSFPDALAVAPLAAATYSPIILVRTNAPLPAASDDVFEFLPIRSAFIVGGTDVVSEEVELAIEVWTTLHNGSSSPATRMEGDDRYETAVSVLRNAVSMNWLDLDTVGIATGANFPDALGGGAALGTYGSPLLLTRPGSLPPSVSAVLTQRAAEIGRVDIFGGEDVVSDAVRAEITGLLP
ncbi:MAG: cell wall-binding repeat-containing protein, partial [Actinomycetota bacterium]|nr:cell wall-binding repeat-containing protein [Actinomycetota bacterium]